MLNYNKMFYLRCKGLNMQEIADDLGCSRVTVQRHFSKLKQMSDNDFKVLMRDTLILSL